MDKTKTVQRTKYMWLSRSKGFIETILFKLFFNYLLLLLKIMTKFVIFLAKLWIKQVDILPSRCTTFAPELQTSTAILAVLFQNYSV